MPNFCRDSHSEIRVLCKRPAGENHSPRRWIRFRDPAVEVGLVTPEGKIPAEILEESFEGIWLLFRDRIGFSRGDQVEVLYRQVPMHGTVEDAEVSDPGPSRVYLLWRAPASTS